MITVSMSAAMALLVVMGCAGNPDPEASAATGQDADLVYTARLVPLNATVTGSQAAGEVTFGITGDRLTIATDARGLPEDMTHWQHFHGFKDGRDATCPASSADANGDRIVDLIETEAVSGTTMVPFNEDPVAMNVPDDTYPSSSPAGELRYEKTVSLSALEAAFGAAFGGQRLAIYQRDRPDAESYFTDRRDF